MGNKRARLNKRKVPKFRGNQFTEKVTDEQPVETAQLAVPTEDGSRPTAAQSMLRPRPFFPQEEGANDNQSNMFYDEQFDYNFVIYFPVLKLMFSEFSRCPVEGCNSQLSVDMEVSKKNGMCQTIEVICPVCGFIKSFYSSRKQISLTRAKSGKAFFDINLRSVLAMREIGKGYEGLSKFCTVMNMPAPMSQTSYDNCVDEIHWAYQLEKEVSMQKVALSVHEDTKIPPTDISQCTVSLDGSWQTRGYSSINGVVTCMYDSKCIDYDIRSKRCKGCSKWSKESMNTPEYIEWKSSHVCPANHAGSSSSMESAGAVAIFKRSTIKYNIQYTNYLGDGDSSSFAAVHDAKPYGPDVVINKLECIGHIQKRIGGRLRDLKSKHRGQKLSDGKGISGRGRLTDSAINKLQNYFGIAIRNNLESVYAMKKCIYASLFHNSSLDDEKRHQFCPRSKESWCSWQKEKAEGKSPSFQPKLNLPKAIYDLAVPIYKELTAESLLQKCLHGKTQNANEALHGLIWQRCPKTVYCGRKNLEVGVASAVCAINDGQAAIKYVLERMSLKPGAQAEKRLTLSSRKRKQQVKLRNSERAKKRRKQLRSIKKGWNDTLKEVEGEIYGAGKF